jgi:dihydrofolate synthase / folylpolyglutamate synthase
LGVSAPDETDPRYQRALQRLAERGRFGIRLGLARTRALLRAMGSPERDLRGVLIGGTNGKGSVQELVAAVLRAANYRVGQTPKPHLVSYRERIMVDGREISVTDFAELVEELLDVAALIERRHGAPTEFELLTAAAFTHLRRAGVEVAVIEVGMGGRLDATNAWQGGLTAITNVALDHTEHLGATIEAIAAEKAQIIKRGDHLALTGAQPPALAVIAHRARRVAVPLRVVEPLPVLSMDRRGVVLAAGGTELRVGLLGRHQAANAALALAVIEALARAGMARVDDEALRRGLAEARWPGRLELIEGRPEVLLDGAHNPHGAAALADALDELRLQLAAGRPTLLIGILRDKDVAGVLGPLHTSRALADALVVTTDVPDSPRALPAAELATAWRDLPRTGDLRPEIVHLPDADEALDAALAAARQAGGPLIICGSLYLVGHARGRLIGAAGEARQTGV